MRLGPGERFRLAPEDEHTHPVEAARSFNESMYANVFDHGARMGGWFRVGNRPNEGHAEVSCCLHFADGSAAFMFDRPAIAGNERLAAGGMAFEVVEPLRCVRVRYDGLAVVLADPRAMNDPKRAFAENPIVRCRVDLELEGIVPVLGGERVDAAGRPVEEPPEQSFARAHYEQHVRGRGAVELDGRRHAIDGLGLRDHSWGPRYWQNIYWYRWLPMAFREDFAMCASIVTLANGTQQAWGMVLDGEGPGGRRYVETTDVRIESTYDADDCAVAQRVHLRTAEREYVVEGRALSLLPLRNRRTTDDGRELRTRITEAMTEFRCDGAVGYGMSEYLDQIVGGVPAGRSC